MSVSRDVLLRAWTRPEAESLPQLAPKAQFSPGAPLPPRAPFAVLAVASMAAVLVGLPAFLPLPAPLVGAGFRGAGFRGARLHGAELIRTVDYADTFTVAEEGGVPERTDGSHDTGSPAYDVEDSGGNPVATWTPSSGFSFNTGLGSACCGYPTNEGNDGAASGLAQSGAGDFSFAYGLRDDYVVELDAIMPLDRLDISSLPSPGAGISAAGSLSVFLRLDSVAGTPHGAFPDTGLPGVGLYDGSDETAVTDPDGNLVLAGVDDARWHRFAVQFNAREGALRIFVDGRFLTWVDLGAFAGGAYGSFSNAAVGAGGFGYDFASRVLWIDNFRVGEPSPPGVGACFAALPSRGVAPLEVDLDASCSFVAADATATYSWDFGDGEVGTGEAIRHVFEFPGTYMVTLTVREDGGETATTSRTVTVYQAATTHEDAFDRPDGPIDGWTVYAVPGEWRISGGRLVTGPTGEERFIWAGDPPVWAPRNAAYSWSQEFLGPGSDASVGRHAGFVFCAGEPTHRYSPGFTGYFVDWLDRAEDRGPRLTRFVRGDGNADGRVDITDGIFVLNFLFLGGPEPTCMDAADYDDDGALNITDGIFVLNFLFLGGADIPPPSGQSPGGCGADPTQDALGCATFPPCG